MDYWKKIKNLLGDKKTGADSYVIGGIYPRRDWVIVLSCVVIGLVIIAPLAVYFYIQIDSGAIFTKTVDDSQGGVNINNTLFKKVVSEIDLRQASSTDLKQNKIKIPDPSL